ncbi:hypothetical protein B0H11DRAFT_1916549 [Mycena galericulata]|nr:hypothetical protein B0H11DRAFT_1916549 [Mycena galericulata]
MNRANPSPAKARADRQLLQGMADASQPCWWKPATLGSSIDPNGLPRAFLFGYVVDEILTPQGRHLILGVPVYNGSTVNTTWMKNSFKRQVRGIHWAQSSNNGSLVLDEPLLGYTVVVDLKLWPVALHRRREVRSVEII